MSRMTQITGALAGALNYPRILRDLPVPSVFSSALSACSAVKIGLFNTEFAEGTEMEHGKVPDHGTPGR
jgi:hypothetical protein